MEVILDVASAQGADPNKRRTVLSDAGGYFQFGDIAPGDYRLQIRVPKGYLPAADASLSVTANLHQTVPADFELRDATGTLYLPLVMRR